jgi:hypothetical protein
MTNEVARVGVVWRGDPSDPDPELSETRLARVFAALASRGLTAVPVVYDDTAVDQARERLLTLDAALVWVDPIAGGSTRVTLDAMLRDVAAQGVWVSAHPDVILKMGTKEVLVQTRDLGWGTDCRLYRTPEELRTRLPALLAAGPRVLKQHRGNNGFGVWKVELADEGAVQLLEAERGSSIRKMTLSAALESFGPYFSDGGCMIDQPYQDLTNGMVRCYLVQDRVAGFGHQYVTALAALPEGETQSPLPPPRLYYGPDRSEFQGLKRVIEAEWVPQMQKLLGLDTDTLPALWDADFLYGPPDSAGNDSFVLCEINVSSVFPFPDEALEPLAEATLRMVTKRKRAT